ncbi:hypothetical protein [Vibrio campbellii]|uniref:hypothetical protein n=1 Tax=Vibrio campbellii TaxID=680 RepID=UPI00249BBA0D|nr:hypothetical protein [Vibrio campbellii]
MNPNIQTKTMLITPEIARSMLRTANAGNRPVCEERKEKFIAIIKFGGWAQSAATITLSHHGNLIDGQHKLHAIAATGKPMPCIVITGADQKDILQHDGTERTMADQLGIIGIEEKDYPMVGAYLKRIYNYSVYQLTNNPDSLIRELPAGMVRMVYQNEQLFIRDNLAPTYHHVDKSKFKGYAGHIAVAARIANVRGIGFDTIQKVLKATLANEDNLLTQELNKGHNKRSGSSTAPIVKAMLDACYLESNQGWTL